MSNQVQVAQMLLNKQAVKINVVEPFVWTSGMRSPIYCDNRRLITHVDAVELIVKAFSEFIKSEKIEFDYLAGTATAGIPWASFLAFELKVPMVYVRSEAKKHGAGKQVEGDVDYLKGKKGLVIEDLVSTGGSSANTAKALKKEVGGEVDYVLSVFEYGFGSAKEAFAKENLKHGSLTDFQTLIGLVDDLPNKDEVLKFADNPADWYKNLNQ